MPYIGNTIRAADDYRLIDDISSSFNGSTTSFALQVAGSAPVPFPKSPQQVLISVNGVIQEPDPSGSSGFNLVGTNIVFSAAPTNGHAFFGIIYATADYLNAGGNFPAGSLGAPSITFIGDENTGLYRKGGGSIGFVADATEIANTDSNGLTISSGNLILPDSIIHNGDSNTKIRFPAADTVSVETAGSERLRVDSSGNVGIGETSPANLLHVKVSDAGIAPHGSAQLVLERSGTNYLQFLTAANGTSGLLFGDTNDIDVAKVVYDHNVPAMQFVTETVERMRIDGTGRIAMGPASSASFNDAAEYLLVKSTTTASNLSIVASNDAHSSLNLGDEDDFNIQKIKSDHTNNSLQFFTNNAERMRIDSSGKVGIGTTSPDTLLHIQRSSTTGYSTSSTTNDSSFLVLNSGAAGHATIQLQVLSGGTANTGQATISAFPETTSTKSTSLSFGTRDNSGNAPAERMRIDSSGKVGIGTTNPNVKLHISASSGDSYIKTDTTVNGGLIINVDGTQRSVFANDSAFGGTKTDTAIGAKGNMIFRTGTSGYTERMRIDSSGKVGIGTTSPDQTLHIKGYVNLETTNSTNKWFIGAFTDNNLLLNYNGAGNDEVKITSAGKVLLRVNDTNTTRVSQNNLQVQNDNNSASTCAGIVLAASSASDTEFNIVTQKHAGGSGADFFLDNGTKARMEMSGDHGDIKFGVAGTMIGTFTPGLSNNTVGLGLEPRNGSIFLSRSNGAALYVNVNTDGSQLATFRRNGNEQGKIIAHSSSVSYETTSDYRLKENEVAISDGITRLKQLKPYRFNFKSNSSETLDGFFAHEAKTVVPECASGTKDEVVVQAQVDSEVYKEEELGNPIYQGIDQSKLVPLLTAALQEEIAKREALETRIAALEAA